MSTALLAYRCRSNFEHKAARELRDQGVNVILPDDTTGKRRKITAPSYVLADRAADITFAKHVRPALPGTATLDAVMRMFRRPIERRVEQDVCPYVVGQAVLNGEVRATVVEVRGRSCVIGFAMLGRPHRQAIHYTHLRPAPQDN